MTEKEVPDFFSPAIPDDEIAEEVTMTLSSIINVAIGRLNDDIHTKLIEIGEWLNQFIYQTQNESRTWKNVCEICDLRVQLKHRDSELHHVARRKYDYRTMTVCVPGCHYIINRRQKLWQDDGWNQEYPERTQIGQLLQGLKEILFLKAERGTDNNNKDLYRQLADLLIEDASSFLRKERGRK